MGDLESSLFIPLAEQEHLKDFFSLMKGNGKKIQAEDMESVIKYMESLQKDLREAIEEVDYLRDQIQAMQDDTLRAKLSNIYMEMQESIHNAWEQIQSARVEVADMAQKAVSACKKKGIQALDKAMDASHIHEGLSRMEVFLSKAGAAVDRKQVKTGYIADDVHEIKGHIKNIGRTMAGKERETVEDRDPSKGIFAKIEKSMEYCKNLIDGMKQNLLRARAHVIHFQLTARGEGEDQIPSVQEIARELQMSANMELSKKKQAQEVR